MMMKNVTPSFSVIQEIAYMQGTRQEKIAKMLQKEFGDIFVLYARRIGNVIISVSEVRVTPDLSMAKVFLSIFPSAKAAEIMERVEADNKSLRYELAHRLRNNLRIIPEFTFYNDETEEKMAHIDDLLASAGVTSGMPEKED
ncbi:MAG: ribosome-binding factor A [Paludibacteraceae bacterium]|nr:ribosome-binding factor A [Paludibacteraceae bacterium]